MSEKVLITCALPYANGPLHFGHIAGAYLPGDCFARFSRLIGHEVFFVCGSDEYGVAITLSAELAGRTPKEHVDHFHAINRRFFEQLNFSFDHFSRTTCAEHKAPVEQFFLDLLENGYIEERVTDQLFSKEHNRFLADRYVVGTCPKCRFEEARGDECQKCGASYDATDLLNPRSKVTGASLTLKKTKHWFLLLDQFKEKLLCWIGEKNWKPSVKHFAENFAKELKARAITRDTDWGIPVPLPEAQGKSLYVWFDAPIGYISASMEGCPDDWKDFWCDPNTRLVQFLGKDNIPFHSVIFPAMVMGQNTPYKLVDDLPANEFYMFEGKQFSKSDGWYIDLDQFFDHFTPDQIRYTIAANAPETSDSEFTWNDFQLRCNSELAGKYGNLVHRVLVFAHKKCGGQVPKAPLDLEFIEKMDAFVAKAKKHFASYHLRQAAKTVMDLADLGNRYFDHQTPWKGDQAHMDQTIANCLECLKRLALISFPIIPEASAKVWAFLGNKTALTDHQWDDICSTPLPGGQILEKPTILFEKIEDALIQEQKELLGLS